VAEEGPGRGDCGGGFGGVLAGVVLVWLGRGSGPSSSCRPLPRSAFLSCPCAAI
jgi:hypothetical protein